MTTISPPKGPELDPGDLRSGKARRPAPYALIVGISAIVLTTLNLAATVYVYHSTRNLQAIDLRLAQLREFEERMRSQLDLMNTGLQSRLETMKSDLQSQLGQFHAGVARLESTWQASGPTTIEMPLPAVEEDLTRDVSIDQPQSEGEPPVAAVAAKVVPQGKKTLERKQEASSAYERIQSSDGKVYYRKVR
jgi:hypothetical protein